MRAPGRADPLIPADECTFSSFALNEVVIEKQDLNSVEFDIGVSGVDALSVNADGLLICSSCGSSAYNSSLRGPLMTPSAANLVVNFFAPFGKNCLPIVTGPNESVEIRMSPANWQGQVNLVLDSNTKLPVDKGDRVRIGLALEDPVRLVTDKTNVLRFWLDKVRGLMKWDD